MADQLLSAIQSYRQKQKTVEDESLLNAIREYRMRGVEPFVREDVSRIEELKQVPRSINLGEGGLPIGEEPMVSGPDVLAMEPGQTKTFTEGPEGKPVEVRRAEAIGITGKVIPEPISPDGMDYEQRAQLLREKEKEFNKIGPSPVVGMAGVGLSIDSPISKEIFSLRQKQTEHDARYKSWLSQMIGGGEGVTPSGEKVQTPTRRQAAIKAVGDFRQQIDDIIVNDKFLEYASTKGLTTPGYWSKKLGRIGIGADEYQSEIEKLQKNPEARKLAEEWAMTTPEFGETVGDLFGRVWDGYAGAIGSGTVGSVGLALKGIGLENVGQELVDAADFADQMRERGQDFRKVGALAQFGRDVAGGVGFTGGALVAGILGNTARATLGLNSARAINLFQKGTTLGFSGLNSAWGGYNEARNNGATDEQAKKAALFSALTQAPLELVSPLQKWIGRFDPAQQSRIYKGLNKAAQAVIEGGQEAFFNEMPQQIAGNLVKKYVYEPNQDIFEGTAYAGGVGGAAGMITSILTQMLGVKRTQQQTNSGNELGSEESDIDSEADKASQDLAPDPESALAAQMMEKSTEIDNIKEEIASDEMGLQAFEEGTPERQQAEMAINAKKDILTQLEGQFDKLSAGPAPSSQGISYSADEASKLGYKNFQYRAIDANGNLFDSEIWAVDSDTAFNHLQGRSDIQFRDLREIKQRNKPSNVSRSNLTTQEQAEIDATISEWDINNKNRQSSEWMDSAYSPEAQSGFSNAVQNGAANLQAHGMAKTGTLSGGLKSLLDILTNGIDPNRGKGGLDTAQLALNKGQVGAQGATASGTSYRDGPFILVQNAEGSKIGAGITDSSQIAAVLVNEANIGQLESIKKAIQAIRPDIIVAPYSQAGTVSAQLTTKSTATKEEAQAKIEELNKEFDALDENDQAGIDRVNQAIFAEQNKLAEMTAIEQGVDPQATTPTREMGLPPSGRRTPFGTFYPDRPVLQAFVKATDKAIAGIKVAGKRAQKLKNAIRTNIAKNAGFLAGINAEVISSEEYGRLTGGKQAAADSGTYRAAFFNGKKYLVLPDVNQLTATTIKGEQRAASRDAALDQESRSADKKLEEEMIHLSMYQALQDEFAALKKPKQTEQQYIVSRIGQIAQEVRRTNPNAVPGVSEAYLGPENGTLDDVGFSMEFMRMVIQRVRTGQITEDLNAIRTAEREAFSDADKGAIASLKNSILNALKFVRNSLVRYLGKGTSTKEVKRMKDAINNILDEYGIVKGEANYEFKDYSAAQPKGEVKVTEEAAPAEAPAPEVAPTPAVSETITPAIEAKAGVTPPNADPLGNVRDQFGPRASGHINDNTPEERILGESQALQRGYPEEFATISAKKTILGELSQTATGVRQTLWEHLGDLYHRAGSTTDYGSMAEKVNKFIRWSKNPREFENQLKSNAIYRATVEKYGNNYTTEAFKEVSESAEGRKAVEDASRKIRYMDAAFASMYEKLQAFTPLQAMGRNMAIAFGLRRYDVAEQLGKSILSAIESREDSVVKYGFNYEGVNNLSRSNNQTKQQFDGITKAGEVVKNDPLRSIEFFRQVSDRITDEELLAPIAMMEEPAIEAKAAPYVQDIEVFDRNGENKKERQIVVEANSLEEAAQLVRNTPEYQNLSQKSRANKIKFFTVGSPRLKREPGESGIVAGAGVTPRVVSEQRRITNDMLDELNNMIDTLQPKRSRAGKEYVSRTTKKGKTYPESLVSPYSRAANLYTSNTYEEATKALNKLFTKNPDADFFSVVSDVANQTDRYGLTESERNTITPILYRLIPAYREEIMESKAAIKDREAIALKSLDLESNLAKLIVDQQQSSARTLNAAKQVRQIGGAGTAVAAYKSKVIDSLADLYTIIRGDFTQVAEAVRGDRRKSVDNVFTLKEVLSKITQLKKKAEKNPQAAADSIRKAIAGKKTRKAREIVLEFCASMFDTKGDKYANMMVDETAKAIMSIGADRKEFSSDNVYRYIYQAFAAVAKQTAKEQAAVGVEPKAKEPKKREGKFLAQVKAVIVNDKAYKEFIKQLKAKIGENYQDQAQFENDYKELFSMLGDRQWSEAMRNQAIKDSADFLDYKFNDLITYIGENRSAAQSAVKAHIRAELSTIGATNEQIDKFVDDVEAYLNEETSKRVKKSLGFEISKETGKIIGGTIEKEAMKKVATAEERFQLAKTLKGLTKLAASDQRAFLDKLNELIITELGFDEATSQELSKYIEEQMSKAIQAQKSENLQQAIERAEKVLEDNKIKPKTNQRTILQRMIEMANMGQLDEFGVYEAFRQTHDFGKGYLEWNPNLANQLREWGDRIAALPEGLTRGIEEQKLGRFMLENQVFSARDYFSSYWYFALLSGVSTQAINITSGAFNLLGNIAVWGAYTKGKSIFPMMRALYRSIIAKEAISRNAFSYVMQTGLNPSGISDQNTMKYPKINVFEGANPGNTPKWGYNLITFGDGKIDSAPAWLNATLATVSPKSLMRLMRAVDAFIREAAFQTKLEALGANPYQKNQYNQAREQAIRELASSKSKGKEKQREIVLRANEIYAKDRLSQEKVNIANEAAEETIYRQDPEGLIGSLAGYANSMLAKYPTTQLFIPFTNTVANVLNGFLNYTPLVAPIRLAGNIELVPLLKGKIKLTPKGMKADFIKGREDKAAEIAIKGMIGFVASFIPFIADAVQDDEDDERKLVEFYDAGPSDPEQNRIWRDNGGIPYSIRVGDKYVSYLFTPLVIPLASGAKVLRWVKENEEKEQKKPVDLIEKYATVFFAPLGVGFVASLEQSFLTGVSDLVDLKNSTNVPKDTLRIATNIVSRLLVPGVMRDVQKMLVDERVEGDNVGSNLLKEMPGSAEFLDKKLGYFGDPARYNSIIEENGLGRRALSLVGRLASSETPDPAFQIMYRNGITPPKWQGSLQWSNEIKMTKPEQREFVSIAGPIMKEWIIDNEEIINDLTTEEAQDYISNNFSQIRRAVKADLEFEKGIGLD